MTSHVKHSMQFMAQCLGCKDSNKQHFQGRYASTELEMNKLNDAWLAGNDSSHYQSTVKTYEITKIDKNVKFQQKCIKRLVFKLFLIL